MAKPREKESALRLRKKGRSIGEIAKSLRISTSTVSHWCKDISLTDAQIKSIAKRSKHHATQSLLRAAEIQRKLRSKMIEEATNEGRNDVGRLSTRDVHMIGLGLYWGEGYKKGNQELGFTNSDPQMIQFYIQWLHTVYDIKKEDLIARISINHIHKNRRDEVSEYWAGITKLEKKQFTKMSLIKTNTKKIYTDKNKHYGTLRIKVRKGTQLRRRILGAIKQITSSRQ